MHYRAAHLMRTHLVAALAALALSACSPTQEVTPQAAPQGEVEPERATGKTQREMAVGERQMLVSANPHASRIGYEMLEQGGTVIDAAIAVQATLTLVEPQSSGIGGGAFILYWDAAEEKLYTFDARETAPASATGELFFEDGKAVSWREGIVGGRATGVPGVLRGLELVHQRHGKLPWGILFEPAADLAENGFEVSPRLSKLLGFRFHPGLVQLEPAASYFYPGGEALAEGTLLKNQDLADNLRQIAREGADYFYTGPLAEEIVAAVQGSALNPGGLTLEDMANYEVAEREALCAPYRVYTLCGMDMPSSGGLAVLQIFRLLEPFDMSQYGPGDVESAHLFTQAARLAYADRDRYAADADFVEVPVAGLLSEAYLDERRSLISKSKDMGLAAPGVPAAPMALADDDSYDLPSTSHMSIVDQYGNALSMTTSIEMAFGSSVMAGGFLLNNQLTDFSLSPEKDGVPVANRVEAGKRPRSSMAPFIVFDENGDVKAVAGAPGGSRIILYVAKTLLGVLDWDLSVQQAVELPNITNRNDVTALEKGREIEAMQAGLEALGHEIKVMDQNSGVHAVAVDGGKLYGGADPRREGLALGD